MVDAKIPLQGLVKKINPLKDKDDKKYFSFLLDDKKLYFVFESNNINPQEVYEKLKVGHKIEITFTSKNNYNSIKTLGILNYQEIDAKEEQVKDIPKEKTQEEWDKLKAEKQKKIEINNLRIFKHQCLNLSMDYICEFNEYLIKKGQIPTIKDIFDKAEEIYQEGIKRGYGK